MQLQPKNDELDKPINKVKDKIKVLKSNLRQDVVGKDLNKIDRGSLTGQKSINIEYEKLAQLRLDQSQSLKIQWESYINEQRQYRKKDIEKRQVEFDKELQLIDSKRRETWKKNSVKELTAENKTEICKQLVIALNSLNTSEETSAVKEGSTDSSDNTDKINNEQQEDDDEMITMPIDILELFWQLDINDIPIFKSELLKTVQLIKNLSI